jgi:glyoxylase-like metal-dependent hydrolase (beta-lactamase superfamily II)
MQISEHIYLVGSEQFGLSHPLDCSCYLIDGGSALALVDAGLGLGVDDIIANIAAAGFDPQALTHILITHAHAGHWGGALELRRRAGAQVWVHELGATSMVNSADDPGIQLNIKFNRYPPGFVPLPCPPDRTFSDGDAITIGSLDLRVILVQGHTKDSVCYLLNDGSKRALFTGDVVFYGGKLGLLNLEGFSLDDYRRDIHKLADLDVDLLLPGHGVFTVRRGQNHIKRAIYKLSDFVMPETFFETNEFMWDRDYLRLMSE